MEKDPMQERVEANVARMKTEPVLKVKEAAKAKNVEEAILRDPGKDRVKGLKGAVEDKTLNFA